MTQGPQGGQAAPMSTGFPAASAARQSATDYEPGSPAGGPSPSTPTSSTPWGSTSTASGTANAPSWSSPPLGTADAPTAAVPLIQESGPTAPAGTAAESSTNSASSANRARGARARGPRRARLQLRHVNPWTVLKFSCVLSIALFFVWLIVVGVLFGILDGAGVVSKINTAYTDIQPNSQPPVRASVVFGGAAIIGVINIVLFVALTTVGSVVYNLCADLVGGIEVTLSER